MKNRDWIMTGFTSMKSRNLRLSLIGGVSGIVFVVYTSLTWELFAKVVEFCPRLFCDFIEYYYPMGKAIFSIGLPVNGFYYSPFNAILLAIFPMLGLNPSLVMWGILQVAAIVLIILFFSRLVPAKPGIILLFIALTLFSYPFWLNFLAGNTGAFMAALLLGSLLAIERGHRLTAAILVALSASFKFYPVIFLLPFLAGSNRGYAIEGLSISILFLFLIPGIILGIGGTFDYYNALSNSFQVSGWVAANPHSQFFPHLTMRLLGIDGTNAPFARWGLHALTYMIAALNLLLVCLIQQARLHRANIWSYSILFLTVPFVLKTSWPIDFAFLPLVQTILIFQLTENSLPAVTNDIRISRRFSASLYCLVLPSIIISNVIFFQLIGNFPLYGYAGFLFMAAALLLVAIYIELLPELRKAHGLNRK